MTDQAILVEASLTSNSLSIAHLTHAFNKPVLTIKGPHQSIKCSGNNALLKNRVAIPIDVRLKQEVSLYFQHKISQALKNKPMNYDQIAERFGNEYPDITDLILTLEYNRIIYLNNSGKWAYNGW